MSQAASISRPNSLAPYGAFAACLAMAGLPLYIHAPIVFAEKHGVGLAALGSVLFGLRLLDVAQDPLLGKLAEATRRKRGQAVALAGGVMAFGLVGLFAVAPPVAPLLWFAITLCLVFSGYSFLTICFYAQGVARAQDLGPDGHVRLARWRETGALTGVCLAAMAPVVLASFTSQPYAMFALLFVLATLGALTAMRGEWEPAGAPEPTGYRAILSDRMAKRLLIVGFLNAAPVAVTATLFLFFVESVLAAPGAEGPLLLLFFASAAVAAPAWGKLAERFGASRVLLFGMALSIAAFAGALSLGAGDVGLFAIICIASGAALGADLTLLPALFAGRMAVISPSAAEGFGLWSFVSKFTLAFAAACLLPALDLVGFAPGQSNAPSALWFLTLLYAGLPCLLKIAAIAILINTHTEDCR